MIGCISDVAPMCHNCVPKVNKPELDKVSKEMKKTFFFVTVMFLLLPMLLRIRGHTPLEIDSQDAHSRYVRG
jgi:hypothetical protein